MRLAVAARIVVAWATVGLFLAFGKTLFEASSAALPATALFLWLLGVIVWSAFGVVEEAEHLAHSLGEPVGTLILTLSIVLIEVALIGAVMLGAGEPTLGRDTMFAVLMIVLNGVVGVALLFGGWRYGQQTFSLMGAMAFLAVILPLTVIALILPNYTRSTEGGTLSTTQSVAFSVFTLALYATFLALQTGRHRDFFVEAAGIDEIHGPAGVPTRRFIAIHTALLLISVLPVVILAKQLAKVLDRGIESLHAPPALGGVLIALVVFMPEGLAAFRAVSVNQLQRTVNLCLGAAASTIGLTVPAVLMIGLATGKPIVLGLAPSETVLLILTLALAMLTFSGPRTTALYGAMHLVVFLVYLTLIFNP
ncbi:MAG TPA: calcium:proton antiporter [Lichenihabitans sp.]|jgi:Ca2+:H+ antiporter|nr:calcium:proton antiporter [Lichenihabitans sp.]